MVICHMWGHVCPSSAACLSFVRGLLRSLYPDTLGVLFPPLGGLPPTGGLVCPSFEVHYARCISMFWEFRLPYLARLCTISRGLHSVLEGSTLIAFVQHFRRSLKSSRWIWCQFPCKLDCPVFSEFSNLVAGVMRYNWLLLYGGVFGGSCSSMNYLFSQGFSEVIGRTALRLRVMS